VTIRDNWRRCAVDSGRVRAARTVRSTQESRGDLTWRCRTATWWRSTWISVFLKSPERGSRASQSHSRTKIRKAGGRSQELIVPEPCWPRCRSPQISPGAGIPGQMWVTKFPAPTPSGRSRSPRSSPASCTGICGPFGCTADGRLFQGARGGPLSESLYGRIWHRPRAAAIPKDGTGAQPVRRPYDLRHAALSLWLASGAPPAEIAARAGHSVRILLTIYAQCIPGCDQIASQHIDRALRPSHWPPAGPQETGVDARNPVRHASVPQLDSTGHSWT
jgi:hypothetical protein